MNSQKIWLTVVVVLIVIGGACAWIFTRQQAGTLFPTVASPSAAPSNQNAGTGISPNANSQNAQLSAGAKPSSLTITAPGTNAQWVFEQSNTISWSRATKVTGGIYLVNAASGKIAGWILQQTGPQQTSYAWNTRDLVLSRTNPAKITVPVGTYVIKVMFDSPQDPTITSAPFSIIYDYQAQIPTSIVEITNGIFQPSTLSIPSKSHIVFVNEDSVPYEITISSFSPFMIPAATSYSFDVTPLSTGPYVFYATTTPTLRMTITIK